MIGRANNVQRVAVVVLRHLQNDEVEPHLLRENLGVERGENVPHVRVVNHAVVAFNEPPEIFVGVDCVGHCGICGRVALHERLHFLHVLGVAVYGCGSEHLFFFAGGRFEGVHQRAVLIREERVQRNAVQNDLFHFHNGLRAGVLAQRGHARDERLQFAQLGRFFVAAHGVFVPLLHAVAQQAFYPHFQRFV